MMDKLEFKGVTVEPLKEDYLITNEFGDMAVITEEELELLFEKALNDYITKLVNTLPF